MFNFKELFSGIALIFILGIVGFLYRNVMENPYLSNSTTTCAIEIKTCPDGTMVGRVGPSCNFAQCPKPNVELQKIRVAFVLPDGYKTTATSSWIDAGTQTVYEANSIKNSSTTSSTIIIRRYLVSTTETANDLMLKKTVFYSSSTSPKNIDEFVKVEIGNFSFDKIQAPVFDGKSQTIYYLLHGNDLLRFDVIEDVTKQSDKFVVSGGTTGQKTLRSLLTTLRSDK